jgi:O-antigen/teichoic acid export membrane protein
LRPSLRAVNRADVRTAVRQGLLWVAIQLGAQVTSSCVPMIISQVKGPEFVALYTVPERILAMVVLLSSMYVQPLWPAYREAIFGGDGKWSRAAFLA